jgi:hypothetical protein
MMHASAAGQPVTDPRPERLIGRQEDVAGLRNVGRDWHGCRIVKLERRRGEVAGRLRIARADVAGDAQQEDNDAPSAENRRQGEDSWRGGCTQLSARWRQLAIMPQVGVAIAPTIIRNRPTHPQIQRGPQQS